jgi:hypothetical protein
MEVTSKATNICPAEIIDEKENDVGFLAWQTCRPTEDSSMD